MGDPRMTTQALTLLAVLTSDPGAEWYGFDLADRAELKTGTLYPLLARLEHAGWLDSRWEEVDPRVVRRPRRRLYVLTPDGVVAGRAALREHTGRLARAAAPRWRPRPEGQLA